MIKMNKHAINTALIGMLLLFLTFTSNAQNGAPIKKYGQDSVKCVQNLSLYRDYYKQKMYGDAYKFWRIVYNICPASSEQMYLDGGNLIEYKMKKATSDEAKKAYIDTLLEVYDSRIQYFGKEGYILGRKGTDMLRYMPTDPNAVYSVLNRSVELQDKNSEAGAMVAYFTVATMLEKSGELSTEDLLGIFEKSNEILAYNLQKYEGKQTHKYYEMAEESIANLASPYVSCEVLEKMANKNFEKNKSDSTWLERNANMLEAKGCTDSQVFFKIAKALHANNPSASSSEKMGITSLKAKRYNDAVNYFNQAIKLAENEDKTADYYVALAQTYSNMGQYATARTNALKAAQIRSGYGLPYIIIGDMYASSTDCGTDACSKKAIYWLAVDYYNKAKSVDPSVSSSANSKIATYTKYFPTTNDCFFLGTTAGDTYEIGCWINESTKARFNEE